LGDAAGDAHEMMRLLSGARNQIDNYIWCESLDLPQTVRKAVPISLDCNYTIRIISRPISMKDRN
jgi:hypothetical protein